MKLDYALRNEIMGAICPRVRQDVYAERVQSKSDGWIYKPTTMPLSEAAINNHLNSSAPIGVYLMQAGTDVVEVAVLDLDDHGGTLSEEDMRSAVQPIVHELRKHGLNPIPVRSGGGKGVHLWMLWDEAQDAHSVRSLLKQIISSCGFEDGTDGVQNKQIEIFPKQDRVSEGKYGNLIALPFARKSQLLDEYLNEIPFGSSPKMSAAVPVVERPRAAKSHLSKAANNPTWIPDSKLEADEAGFDIEQVSEALEHVPADDRDTWFKIGAALHHADDTEEGAAYDLWAEWSQGSAKYNETDQRRTWNSFDGDREDPISLATLFRIAREHGWKPGTTDKLPEIPQSFSYTEELISRASWYTLDMMKRYGNQLTEEHEQDLRTITEGMVRAALSSDELRIAFPLQTGMGKTTAVKGFIKALAEMNYLPISLLYVAERIEQLCELKKDLIDEGIHERMVGLLHSYSDSEIDRRNSQTEPECTYFKSIKKVDVGKYRILLVTHAQLKLSYASGENKLPYAGKDRDLSIWDESMISTKGWYYDTRDIRDACSVYRNRYETKRPDGHDSHNPDVYDRLYKDIGTVAELLKIPPKGETVPIRFSLGLYVLSYEQAIDTLLTDKPDEASCLKALIKMAQHGEIRTAVAGDGVAILGFAVVVPDEIKKIVILDASAPIKELVRYDRKIKMFNGLRAKKHYSKVTINFYEETRSSKNALSKPEILKHYLDWMGLRREAYKDKKGLVCTHKDANGVDCKQAVRKRLNNMGIGITNETAVVHWGMQKGVNKHKDVEYINICGMPHRNPHELDASIIGQNRRLDYVFKSGERSKVQCSEQADAVYQLISRGKSRKTIVIDGRAEAEETVVDMPHNDPHVPVYLLEVMPSVNIVKHRPLFSKKTGHDARLLAEDIEKHLKDCTDETITISDLREAVAPGLASNTSLWRKGRDRFLSQTSQWERVGRSLKRVPYHAAE